MARILVIDDDELCRKSLSRVLNHSGFAVMEAESGEKGVAIARQHLPDLIISDVMMSELDGFGVFGRLQMDPATASVPVIFMTGSPERAGLDRSAAVSAHKVLVKPFALSRLLAEVQGRLTQL